jgi:hypothetical protein
MTGSENGIPPEKNVDKGTDFDRFSPVHASSLLLSPPAIHANEYPPKLLAANGDTRSFRSLDMPSASSFRNRISNRNFSPLLIGKSRNAPQPSKPFSVTKMPDKSTFRSVAQACSRIFEIKTVATFLMTFNALTGQTALSSEPLTTSDANTRFIFDFPDEPSAAVVIANGRILPATKDEPEHISKLNQVYLWQPSGALVYLTDTDADGLGLYLNRRQHRLMSDKRALSNLDLALYDDNGLIKSKVIEVTEPIHKGHNDFGFAFSDRYKGNIESVLRCDSKSHAWTLRDGAGEFYVPRDALGHDFFGHPLMFRFIMSEDDQGQINSGMITKPLELPRSGIVNHLFSIDSKFLEDAFAGGLKTAGKMPGEFKSLIRNRENTFVFARDSWNTLKDVMALLDGNGGEQVEGYVKAIDFTRSLNLQIDDAFSSGPAVILDPLLRGVYLDNLSWFDETRYALIGKVLQFQFTFSHTEFTFALMSTAYSLGIGRSSRCYYEMHQFAKGELKPEIRAALAAHWHLPVKESEIDAVVELLKAALLPSARSEAIDVLVLLGQIDKIPADRMTSWADANVLKAEPKLLRRKLAYLMKTKSGRDYLRGQMTSPAMSAETLEVVKAVITKHVEATRKLKRFDMISEEEVGELETAISG